MTGSNKPRRSGLTSLYFVYTRLPICCDSNSLSLRKARFLRQTLSGSLSTSNIQSRSAFAEARYSSIAPHLCFPADTAIYSTDDIASTSRSRSALLIVFLIQKEQLNDLVAFESHQSPPDRLFTVRA